MAQKGAIASLLKQQEEILRELRDQKKGTSLSQSDKEEIARLVLSSIEKRHLQDPTLATQEPFHVEALRANTGRSKRIKPIRRHQEPFRSSSAIQTIRGGVIKQPTDEHEFMSPERQLDNKALKSSFPFFRGLYSKEDHTTSTTIIRKSAERQPEAVQVSLDGSWLLPSISFPENQSQQDGLQSREVDRCAEPSRSKMTTSPSKNTRRTRRWLGSKYKLKPRPATVASDVYRTRGPTRGRLCVGSPSNRSLPTHCNLLVDPSTSGVERVEPGSETYSRSAPSDEKNAGEGGGEVKINRDMLVMLDRSRELVAKAKAFCGNPGRSPPPYLLNDTERDKISRAEGSAYVGHDLTTRCKSDPGENRGELGGLTGEASSIIFPFLSPRAIPFDIGVAREGDVNRNLAPLSEARRDGTAIVGLAPERSHIDCSDAITGWRVRQGESMMTDRLRDDLESAPVGAEDDQAHAILGLSRVAGDETVRTPERLGREGEYTGESFASRCGAKAEETSTVATRGMPVREDHPSAPFAACASPARLGSDGATTSTPHEHLPVDVRAGATSDRGALSKSSLLARSGAPGRCHEGPDPVRLKRRWNHSHVDRDGVGRYEGKFMEGGDGGNEADSPVKVESEWENTLARNILSLYQTKLEAELDEKKGAQEEGSMRNEPPGYLTAKEVLNNGDTGDETIHSINRGLGPRGRETDPNKRWGASPHDRTLPIRPSCFRRRPTTSEATIKTRDGVAMTALATDERFRPRKSIPAEDVTITTEGDATLSVPKKDGEIKSQTSSRTRIDRGMEAGNGAFSSACTSLNGGTVAMTTERGGFRGNRTISVPTRRGREVVVVVPKRPAPIWFAGSGAIQAEWSALPGGTRVARDLESLEEYGSYRKYVAVVEGLLTAHLRADDQRGPTSLVKRLWRQLVVTCTAFGVRSLDNRRFERALELLKRAGILLSRQVLDKQETMELRAFISDAYGLYYLRRSKPTAALDYVQKAMRTHARMKDWGHVTKCHLHSAVVLSKLNRHDEALRCLGQVLSMVQDGKLDIGGNSPQKLCLVAICYHNMAVEQLILRHAGEACMSSQNARRLACLCLSYSNRWLHSFEGTHKLALAEVAKALPPPGEEGSGDGSLRAVVQKGMLDRLVEELFS